MDKNVMIYCDTCDGLQNHELRFELNKQGKAFCTECQSLRPLCLLSKKHDPSFRKLSKEIKWVEWKDGIAKELKESPEIGDSLLMSPFNVFFTWQTTPIIKFIKKEEGRIEFKTKNSYYILYY